MADKGMDARYEIPDEFWERIQLLLPPEPTEPKGSRQRIDARKAMEAILYVFRTGCKWGSLPRGLGSPGTVRRRLREWQKAGVFQRMWQAGLLEYDEMRKIVWYGKKWRMPPKR